MDAIQSKSITKRHRKNDKNPLDKKQRLELPDDAEQKMKITDVIDDCLAMIFGHLDVENLLNVAIACKYLVPAVADVFKRKHSKKEFVINECDDFHPNMCGDDYAIRSPKERNTNIGIYGLKASLLYLRYFGSCIQNLTIDYYKSESIRYEFVHQYINTYCTESIISISFMHLPCISIERFEKPFTNVRNVMVRESDLSKQLTSCGKWFPNMRRLKLANVRFTDDFDQTSFRHLKHLCVCLDHEVGLKKTDVAQLLQSNRRLRSLQIEVYDDSIAMNTLLNLIKDQTKLTKLDMRLLCEYSNLRVHSTVANRIANEQPSLVRLHLPQYKFETNDVIALVNQLNTLKSFRFRMRNTSELESKLDKTKWICADVYDWNSKYVKLNRKK